MESQQTAVDSEERSRARRRQPDRIFGGVFWFALALVFSLSYLLYFMNYSTPNAFFWDENYHVPSAQRYLNRIFFMEPHPPLGKLLLAAGERLIKANRQNDHFIDVDYAPLVPGKFSFAGYRFFPVLFAFLTAPVLFLILFDMTRRPFRAFFFTTPFLFDNAFIAHLRGAMLEGPQLFFIACALLVTQRIVKTSGTAWVLFLSLLQGMFFGLAFSTKINSLILLPLLMLGRRDFRVFVARIVLSLAAALLVTAAVWQIHFELGVEREAVLPDSGYYHASDAYRTIIDSRDHSLSAFGTALTENFKFARDYTAKAPAYNAKSGAENGSKPYLWPIAGSMISYVWRRDGQIWSAVYLTPNLAVWYFGLAALLIATSLLIHDIARTGRSRFSSFATTLIAMYWGYMITVLQVARVLYIYHYFVPLLLVMVLQVELADRLESVVPAGRPRFLCAACAIFLILLCFLTFYPLTYFMPLSEAELRANPAFWIWDKKPSGVP
jgi:dolichyl-phosphate-mannose--protein O-mannosyl transferase